MKDSNVRPNALNLIQEKVGDTLELVGTGKGFLNRTSVVQALRPTVGKWDIMKLKGHHQASEEEAYKMEKKSLPAINLDIV